MIAIFVQKSWLETIGDIKDLLFKYNHPNDMVALLAGTVQANYPFVEARLARTDGTEDGEYFLDSHIPAHVVTGMFDLTEGEASEYGFVPHKKKKK